MSNIKKVRILKNDLPPINAERGKYLVRYRIISEDRNRISHWSPQFEISPVALDLEAAEDKNISISKVGESLVVRWNISARALEEFNKNPTLSTASYDVYVAWGSTPTSVGNLEYYATISGNFINIPQQASSQSVRIVIQNITYPKNYLPSVAIADSDVESLVV